jgi:hypothetical protein
MTCVVVSVSVVIETKAVHRGPLDRTLAAVDMSGGAGRSVVVCLARKRTQRDMYDPPGK